MTYCALERLEQSETMKVWDSVSAVILPISRNECMNTIICRTDATVLLRSKDVCRRSLKIMAV